LDAKIDPQGVNIASDFTGLIFPGSLSGKDGLFVSLPNLANSKAVKHAGIVCQSSSISLGFGLSRPLKGVGFDCE